MSSSWSPSAQFFLEVEDLLFDDDAESMIVTLAMKELEGRKNKKRRGSTVGRLYITRTVRSIIRCSYMIILPRTPSTGLIYFFGDIKYVEICL
jgi:hypothetical protein